MRFRPTCLLTLILAGILLAPGLAPAAASPMDPESPRAPAILPPGEPAPELDARRFIVMLDEPPLALYQGGIGDYAATSIARAGGAGRGGSHLDWQSPAARRYAAYLTRRQEAVQAAIRAFAPQARFDWSYRYTFNGFTVKLDAAQFGRLAALPGVALAFPTEKLEPEMDYSLPLINAPAAWEVFGGPAGAGLSARVAIIDGGQDVNHPFFNDEGMPEPPEGFPKSTLHLNDGTVGDYSEGLYVNNKLIGARIFISPDIIQGHINAGRLPPNPTTDQIAALVTPYGGGHGNHVAGTVAGRHGEHTVDHRIFLIDSSEQMTLSGVAPQAWVFNYSSNFAETAEMIAMLDQMVMDEIDAFNMSLGTASWLLDTTERHPLTHAFTGAAEAGVVAVMSAGNAGSNGRTSLSGAFKYAPSVLAVASASTSGSAFELGMDFAGEGVPAPRYQVGPRGNQLFTQTISAPLMYVPDGGCAVTDTVAGKIAVVERFDANVVSIGACDYPSRAVFMKDSGAVAILYVYYDRAAGDASATALALPGLAVGSTAGIPLVEWLKTNPPDAVGTLDLEAGVARRTIDADVLAASSSRGPGLAWQVKPDLAAPGVNILSSVTGAVPGAVGNTPYFGQMSGTSMATPHVTGAAGLVRSAHPEWTSAQVRSAIVTTTAPETRVSQTDPAFRPATPYETGGGRLNLERVLDPGLFLMPYHGSFGRLSQGELGVLRVWLESATDAEQTWTLAIEPAAGDAEVSLDQSELSLAPGEKKVVTLSIDTDGVAENEHFGAITLTGSSGTHHLRMAYYAWVDIPDASKDVLLVNWTFGNTPDHGPVYTGTLDELGLSYDVWHAGEAADGPDAVQAHPPFHVMARYKTVILNTNESKYALNDTGGLGFAGAYQWQNYPLSGGNLLVTGQGTQSYWTYRAQVAGRPNSGGIGQNTGCDFCVSRYFAGYHFGITATLSGRLLTWPERPDTPEMEVILQPAAPDGPFGYAVDISTGALAKDGAAGNQYTFASGAVVAGLAPQDPDTATSVVERIAQIAQPMWQYGDAMVGAYILGKDHPEAGIPWNGMFWGFGLEGVGKGAEGTATRAQLLGDALTLLGTSCPRLPVIEAVAEADGGDATLQLEIAAGALAGEVEEIHVDWGDGSADTITGTPPASLPALDPIEHAYEEVGDYSIAVTMTLAGVREGCPNIVHTTTELSITEVGGKIFLPVTMLNHEPEAPTPAWWRRE